jgi:hypothetical protein
MLINGRHCTIAEACDLLVLLENRGRLDDVVIQLDLIRGQPLWVTSQGAALPIEMEE